MPQQEYIKYLYEKEDFSINKISKAMGVNWRTAAKYAKNDDWNKTVKPKQKRKRPVMEPFAYSGLIRPPNPATSDRLEGSSTS